MLIEMRVCLVSTHCAMGFIVACTQQQHLVHERMGGMSFLHRHHLHCMLSSVCASIYVSACAYNSHDQALCHMVSLLAVGQENKEPQPCN
jgi:hypothetical protein